MSEQWHPLLTEEGELPDEAAITAFMNEGAPEIPPVPTADEAIAAAAQAPQPTEEVAPSPEPAPAEATVEVETPQPSEDDLKYYRISRENLYQDLLRLANEDETFKQRGGEVFGRKAKRDAQTRISELEATIANLQRERELAELRQVEPEEIDRRYAESPEFARRYTELVHGEPVSVREVAEMQYFRNTADDLKEQAAIAGVPKVRLDEYTAALEFCPNCRTDQHGFFDHDEDGSLFLEKYADDSIARRAAFDRFRSLLSEESNAVRLANARLAARPAPAPAAPAPPPAAVETTPAPVDDGAGTPNAKLLPVAPDTTTQTTRPQAGQARYTHEDLMKNYSWDQIIEMFPNDGDYERAVEQGLVTLTS